MRNTGFNMIVSLPDGETKHYSLNTDKIRIGRGAGNQITIPVNCVSSHHCEIFQSADGQFLLADLGSKNGTEINGTKLIQNEKAPLNDGDFILFGQTVYGQIVSVSNLDSDQGNDSDVEVGKALAELTKQSSTAQEDNEEVAFEDEDDLEEEYDDITINPVAAAVARATRSFSSD